MLQLHGGEPPPRVAEIRERFGLPVIKAISVTSDTDFQVVPEYGKSPIACFSMHGHPLMPLGLAATRTVLTGIWWAVAAGLTLAARRRSCMWATWARPCGTVGAATVDVSSGVEDAPGHKSAEKIHDFLAAAARL